jgi:hypothetical protein
VFATRRFAETLCLCTHGGVTVSKSLTLADEREGWLRTGTTTNVGKLTSMVIRA